MENPFETIARRLTNIEDLLLDIKHRPASNINVAPQHLAKRIDIPTVMKEFYPGIPESTVRQDTAHLSRFKVGKRILLDREEVEEHLRNKRRHSSSELTQQVDADFSKQHRSRVTRKAA